MRARRFLFALIGQVLSLAISASSTGAPPSSRPSPHDAISLSRSKIYRWRQRWTRGKISNRLPVLKNTYGQKGSLLTLQRPTTERISQWFWGKDTLFNHGSVGMTNPCLHIAVNDEGADSLVATLQVSNRQSRTTTGDNIEQAWWPQTACPLENTSWRVLRFRRRVGRGLACYQRVRDAALQWEFSSPAADKGMLQVEPAAVPNGRYARGYSVHSVSEDNVYAPVRASDQTFNKIWSGPGRRLVTYTATRLRLRWTLHLFAINPVAVVYDLVDERGPATTYSATAYATEEGHLLRGEERVTVALRDCGNVDVEIISFSKPAASVKGRVIWPVIGGMQKSFFIEQLNSLQRVAETREELESVDMSMCNIMRIQ